MYNGSFRTDNSGYAIKYALFEWEFTGNSIENNESYIKWTLKGDGGAGSSSYTYIYGGTVTVDGEITYLPSNFKVQNGTVIASGTKTIKHDDNGYKSFSASASVKWYTTGNTNKTGSGSWELPIIYRASAPSLSNSNFNIGNTITIYTNRLSSSFVHTIRVNFGSFNKTLANGVSTNYNWDTNVDANNLYSKIPNANNGAGTIYLDTYYGDTLIGTKTVSFKANVANSNPIFTIDKVSYKDNNPTTFAITNNNQLIVRNLSILNVIIGKATAQNYASITGYELVFNGTTKIVNSGTTNLNTINLSNNSDLIVRAVDSRGNRTNVTKVVTILDWVLPQAVITAKRVNNFEDETNLKANISISSVNNLNSIKSIKYRYKKTIDDIYSNYDDLENNVAIEVIFDKLFAWNVQIEIKDKFGMTTYNVIVQKGVPIMFIDIDKLSIGIGKFPTNLSSLDVDIINGSQALNWVDVDEW